MLKLLLTASVVICDLYLFHISSLLNPDFRLVNNLIPSSLDKVTTGTYDSHLVIFSVGFVGAAVFPPSKFNPVCSLVIMQFLFHFNSKNISQVINGIFNALQKLPKYFNNIADITFDVPALPSS